MCINMGLFLINDMDVVSQEKGTRKNENYEYHLGVSCDEYRCTTCWTLHDTRHTNVSISGFLNQPLIGRSPLTNNLR